MALVTNIVNGSNAKRLLLLVHGYGADEQDLGGLLPYLDPDGQFATVLPRGPMSAPGTPGYMWFPLDGSGNVEFADVVDQLDALVDDQCAALGFNRADAIFGGFSQGGALALALGLLASEPAHIAPAGVLAMSPLAIDGDLADSALTTPVLVQHGRNDPMIPVQRSRDLARSLQGAGVPTVYKEYAMEHQVALDSIRDARAWFDQIIAGEKPNVAIADDPVELVPAVTTAQWDSEVLRSEVPVIVDFWAPWCGPCRQVSPVVETIAAMRRGSYKVVKVNIDDEPRIAQEYQVQSIPMIGLFRNGRLERATLGAKPRQQIEAELGMLVIP